MARQSMGRSGGRRDRNGAAGGRRAEGRPQGGRAQGRGRAGASERSRAAYAPRAGEPRGERAQRAGRTDERRPRDGASRGDLIEGRRAVEEALELGLPITRAIVQKGAGQDQTLEELVRKIEMAGIDIERVPRPILDSLSSHGAHQGIMLRVRPYRYAELADVISAAGEGDALVVVLDHVTDEGNFGAIVRSAEVVGAAGIVIAKARAARVGVGAYKTSAGAVMHLPIAQVPNLTVAIDELKEAGFWAGGATEHAHDSVWEAPVSGRLALVVGSEGSGISRLVRQKCDFEFKLPQRGRVESLNVAQATTAICYEWLRRTTTGEAGE